MKKILVATDFSHAAHDAIAYAAQLAKALDTKLALLHVVFPPILPPEGGIVMVEPTLLMLQEQQEALQQEVAEWQAHYNVPIEDIVKEGGAPGTIVDTAKDLGAGLIIMGAKSNDTGSHLLGNTVTAVVRKSTIPVLVVPQGITYTPITPINFAADFDSHIPAGCYDVLHTITRAHKSHVNIVHVQKDDSDMDPDQMRGKLQLASLMQDIPHEFFTLYSTDTEQALEDFNTQHPANLLVMVAHQHNFFKRLFGEVHTHNMSYSTRVPLLVLQDK